jgi:uncharacterized membrane protein
MQVVILIVALFVGFILYPSLKTKMPQPKQKQHNYNGVINYGR